MEGEPSIARKITHEASCLLFAWLWLYAASKISNEGAGNNCTVHTSRHTHSIPYQLVFNGLLLYIIFRLSRVQCKLNRLRQALLQG